MKGLVVIGGLLLMCSGCASVPRTTTYQTTQWKEVEEPTPSVTRIIQADIPQVFPGAKKGRKYLNIGYKPVNPNRELVAGEIEFILPADAYVTTIDRDNKRSVGWLLAGERVIGAPTTNPDYYKAIWIRRCGNPILNEEQVAVFIRVRRETVAQAPTKRWVQETVNHTRELTCRERKAEVSWWRKGLSYVVTGAVGTGGALIGGKVGGPYGIKIGAGIGVLTGRLVGGYTDGSECIDGTDVVEGVVLGVTAGMVAPMNARPASPPAHTLPTNGGGGNPPPAGPLPAGPSPGHTLPTNGGGGYTPPVNPVTRHTLPFN